ncbi:MFS transporter [Rhizobium leguminosarum]|uniref:MFS transporter n=1 Tax=Rhizobium leguminosarum TaxID=384 RepID=UPI000DE33897|nr:MFS transporter [Rhizobium leguminosarum]MBY5466442.1 MFS transporter [Rhizobium leguminosarum]TCA59911.1 MFS transporter [Rhizobium leguminosarum bv. viciae]TCB24658.1 MFS transporter [Rhizobium leguminosarum bv. viciae]
MFNWYRELTKRERNTFWGCFAGWAVDAMDAQLFSFVLPVLIAAWGMSTAQAGYLATATLLSAAVGGWACGYLADRFGRVRIMQFTILWFSVFTFLAAFTQNFEQLIVVRVLQGLGFGGEWAAGAVLMGEIIRPAHRGKAVGSVQSGFGVGWSAAAILAGVILAHVPAEYAWRTLLMIGVLPGFLVLYLRRSLEEPELYQQTRAAIKATGRDPGLSAIFRPGILHVTILASLLAFGVVGVGGAIVNWLPTFMKTVRHLSPSASGYYIFLVTGGSFFGFLASAYLSDVLGRRRTFQLFLVCSWLVTIAYMFLPLSGWGLILMGVPFGFFTIGNYAALGPFFTELFPTAVRGSGQSFAYNFGKAAGAIAVSCIGILAQWITLAEAIGLIALLGYSIAITATLLLPETKGINLTASLEQAPEEAPSIAVAEQPAPGGR